MWLTAVVLRWHQVRSHPAHDGAVCMAPAETSSVVSNSLRNTQATCKGAPSDLEPGACEPPIVCRLQTWQSRARSWPRGGAAAWLWGREFRCGGRQGWCAVRWVGTLGGGECCVGGTAGRRVGRRRGAALLRGMGATADAAFLACLTHARLCTRLCMQMLASVPRQILFASMHPSLLHMHARACSCCSAQRLLWCGQGPLKSLMHCCSWHLEQ